MQRRHLRRRLLPRHASVEPLIGSWARSHYNYLPLTFSGPLAPAADQAGNYDDNVLNSKCGQPPAPFNHGDITTATKTQTTAEPASEPVAEAPKLSTWEGTDNDPKFAVELAEKNLAVRPGPEAEEALKEAKTAVLSLP